MLGNHMTFCAPPQMTFPFLAIPSPRSRSYEVAGESEEIVLVPVGPAVEESAGEVLEAVAFVFPERPVVRWNRADGCRWRELLATWTFVCSAADWSLSTENRHQREFPRQPLRPVTARLSRRSNASPSPLLSRRTSSARWARSSTP